jgi:AraC-like DNA-binding protein
VAMIQKDFLLDHPLYNALFQSFPVTFASSFQLEQESEAFIRIFNDMETEYTGRKPNYEAVIQTYLLLLFNLLKRHSKSEESLQYPPLLQKFFEMLEVNFKTRHEIGVYAGQLHVTAKTLNAACKKFLGKTAGAIIHERLTAESKKQLLYSHKNLTELAYELGFTDPSHFNKFFKRQTGVLPGIYRKGIS